MQRRQVLALAVAGPLAARMAVAQDKPAQIVVNDSGGASQTANRKAFYSEFDKKFGVRVAATSPIDLGKLRAMVQSGNVEWTVTEMGGPDAVIAERAGLLEPLDHSIIDMSRFPKNLQNRKFVFPKSAYSTVIGFRSDVLKGGGPKNWADFFDVQKFPGPRTMQNTPIENLEFALMADGVPMDKLYPLDVERAFRKLDQLKRHVAAWWTTGAQSAQLLVDKEAVIGTAWNGRYYSAMKQGLPITMEWNQGAIKESAFGIPKGARDAVWGQRLLAVMADARLQARYADEVGYPGLNLDATQYTNKDIVPFLPTSPENLPRQFWVNLEWWADNGPAIQERWARWLLQK